MRTPEVRLSPDGKKIAMRFVAGGWWTVQELHGFDCFVDDAAVADWTPLLPVSTPERVTCPHCGRDGRALDPQGRIRWHHGIGVWWSRMCPGTGIRMTERRQS